MAEQDFSIKADKHQNGDEKPEIITKDLTNILIFLQEFGVDMDNPTLEQQLSNTVSSGQSSIQPTPLKGKNQMTVDFKQTKEKNNKFSINVSIEPSPK
ncbi:hypothetical protein [Secundilactobacillus silagei]|uniref:Uncharacterized protein n=1 Tax=Secundilactobacillus silagei JCM 19001 TaxID=1302250 RepID=A0A1Z5H3V2_9LACO|nr:hypothetical protein [Secundilactobacillus silagei]TDG70377.1 hypothetical protein C5L25_001567 [Secundilactobacillus silagei JCM 19001]GAT17851.1 hypothetical protein IWT126_00108 [Secundilactobacillus silagei JCM 19001]